MAKQLNDKKYIKGLFKDTGPIDQPGGTWRYARNTILNDTSGAVSNEGGTELNAYLGDAVFDKVFRDIGDPHAKVIGKIEVDNDRVVLFSLNKTEFNSGQPYRCEIGIWTDGIYSALFNPNIVSYPSHLLQFSTNFPIEGTFKLDSKGDLIVYWTDDLNPPRAFNISRQQRWIDEFTVLLPQEWLYGIDPANSHLDHLNLLDLFPNSGPIPHIAIHDIFWVPEVYQKSVTTGGGLLTGVYHLGLAYVDDDQVSTNYVSVSNPVSIVGGYDHTNPTQKKDGAKAGSQTSKAIKWKVSNLNTDYKYMRPVIIRKRAEAVEAFKLNVVEINPDNNEEQEITFSGLEGFTSSSVEDVIIDTTSYETAKTINQLDGVLYLGNLTGSKDLGYQKYANNIKLSAKTKVFKNFDTFYATLDNLQTGFGNSEVNVFNGSYRNVDESQSYRYIPNITNWKGYQRDEIYAFYIAFILKDGSTSYAYHIPGRAPNLVLTEIDGDQGLASYNGKEIYEHSALGDDGTGSITNMISGSSDLLSGNNTRIYEDLHKLSTPYSRNFHFFDTSASTGANNMNYWENATETYPNTDDYDIWDETGKIGSLRNDGIYNTSNINVRHHHFPSNSSSKFTTVMSDTGTRSGDQCEVEPSNIATLPQDSQNWDVTFFAFAESKIGLGDASIYKRSAANTPYMSPATNTNTATNTWSFGFTGEEINYDIYELVSVPIYGYDTGCANANTYDWIAHPDAIQTITTVLIDSTLSDFTNGYLDSVNGPGSSWHYLTRPLTFRDSTPYGQVFPPSGATNQYFAIAPTNFQPLPSYQQVCGPTPGPVINSFMPGTNIGVTHPSIEQLNAFDTLWDGDTGVFTASCPDTATLNVKVQITAWWSSATLTNQTNCAVVARVRKADGTWIDHNANQSANGGTTLSNGGANFTIGSNAIPAPLADGSEYVNGKEIPACSNYGNSSPNVEHTRQWNVLSMEDADEWEFDLEHGDKIYFRLVGWKELTSSTFGDTDLDADEQMNLMYASGCMDFDTEFDDQGNPTAYPLGWHKYNVSHSQIQFKVKTIAGASDPQLIPDFHLNDVKIEHKVQALGFTLDDIKIPKSIADKVQGFRIYYANRDHSNKSILGQAPSLPMIPERTKIGICYEASTITSDNPQEIMSTLSDESIAVLRKHPYGNWNTDYDTYKYIYEGADSVTDYNGYKSFFYPDFHLLRTRNSLSAATFIKPVYHVQNFAWNGPHLLQDKKMVTEIIYDTQYTPPLKRIQQNWGYDKWYNCWSSHIRSAFFIGCHYNIMQTTDTNGWYNSFKPFNLPRVIGQKAITYLKGDSIFSAESLGFGGTVVNEKGESTIIYSLKDRHELAALWQSPNGGCSEYSHYGVGNEDDGIPFTLVGDPLTGLTGTSNQTPISGCNRTATLRIDNLCAFKTDVYKSIDDQELVWTGFEVLGNDLNNFVFWDNDAIEALPYSLSNPSSGQPVEITYSTDAGNVIQPADYSIYTLQSEIQRTNNGAAYNEDWGQFHIFGGDTFICRYGFASSITYNDEGRNCDPRAAGYHHIVESPDNINFRHIESIKSSYFPGIPAKDLLNLAVRHDLTDIDNIKYNDNYSEVNNIRPAFPLPLFQDDQDDFPTRTHRSVKTDTTSLIDNYRIFKANQFKDLPKHRGDLWKLSSFNNLLYFHMQESLYAAKGKQQMQMKDGSEAFVGSGDIFQQEPDEVIQTKGGFGGTQSQWAALTSRAGYFFVDGNSKKVFLMKDKLSEISNLGMSNWFEDNMPFELENYGYTGCDIDNPIRGMGFHSIYDPVHKRIMLTKRELVPSALFIEYYNLENVTISPPCNSTHALNKIRFNAEKCTYEQWSQRKTVLLGQYPCHWKPLPLDCKSKYFTCTGWTISFYTELSVWGSFHDYIPYLYFNTSTDFYSLTDKYDNITFCTPFMITNSYDPFCLSFDVQDMLAYAGTTYGNSGIWKHNSFTNHGIIYQENSTGSYTTEEWLESVSHYPFEFEFIHNESKTADALLASFAYTLETLNQSHVSVLEHGFTSFFVYNTFQISGEEVVEYLINTRRVGNSWKINAFRDIAAIVDQTGNTTTGLNLPNISNYYTATGTNIIGGQNTGTLTTSSINSMFIISGMTETINPFYIDTTKSWDKKRKFIDKWVGIRLIYDNISNNLLNLYSTNVVIRKLYR